MTLYEKIIAYGDAREELAEVRVEIKLAGKQRWPCGSKKRALDDLKEYWLEKTKTLLADIELQLDLFSIDQR